MVNIIFIVLVVSSILNAMYFTYKWYALYIEHENITWNDIFLNGKYRPRYISVQESPFERETTSRLNRRFLIVFMSMGIGIIVAIIFKLQS